MYAAARYGQVQGETATAERQMALLFETAMGRIRAGISELESGQQLEAARNLQAASKIVNGLMSCLRPSVAPELCARLGQVYTFVCQRLLTASLRHDVLMAREAQRVFEPVASAFVQAAAQVGASR